MKILKFFKRKEEKKEEKKVEVVRQPSELEILCGDDKEVYLALRDTLLLKPPSEKFSIEGALEEASQKEKGGDLFGAGLCFLTAGQISLFNGNVEGVKKFFSRCQELTGKKYLILTVPEKAVEVAQAYYQKLLNKTK